MTQPEPLDLSCLGCGQIGTPSTVHAPSGQYLCAERCVPAIRWRPAVDELVAAALWFNVRLNEWQDAGRVSFREMDPDRESDRFFKALDPFRYDYPRLREAQP